MKKFVALARVTLRIRVSGKTPALGEPAAFSIFRLFSLHFTRST
jgi:hypothetical protein